MNVLNSIQKDIREGELFLGSAGLYKNKRFHSSDGISG
jgi:hypothetical protein